MKAPYLFVFAVLVLLFIVASVSAQYYTIPVMTLTNSPLDSVTTYFGNRPIIPTTVAGNNKVYIPNGGVIERVEIYDYSGTAGSNQAYTYYIRINNAQDYLVKTLSVAANERIFTNSSINIPVNSGDYFEVKRVHPVWGTNPLTNIVGGYVFINGTVHGYAIPMQALTNSPADSVQNYMGQRPVAPSTVQGTNKFYIPAAGNISRVDIYDNSSGAQPGTNEVVSYYVQVNGGNQAFIASVATGNNTGYGGERIFQNSALWLTVNRGDYVEFKRENPLWVVNPLLNIVGGNAYVNTEISGDPQGYQLQVQAITSSPVDAQTVYFGNRPIVPSTTGATNKVYIPKSGTINRAEIYVYSGTAGTRENWDMYIRINNANDYLISTINASASERMFKNATMGIPVNANDYFEIKSVQPTWATNPATTIYGGYVYIEEAPAACGQGGGDIILPPVADFSANLTPASNPAVVQFFDQSNNTIPGTTLYYWNFTDGGTGVDSTDINPAFTYATTGEKTVNHTVSSGGVMSKATKTVSITGGTATAAPQAYFNITLTDTSTQYPNTWQWNATNLTGNNVEFTFSTAQNPKLELGTGNWLIKLNVTNAFGSNSTTQNIGWNLTSPIVHFWSRTG